MTSSSGDSPFASKWDEKEEKKRIRGEKKEKALVTGFIPIVNERQDLLRGKEMMAATHESKCGADMRPEKMMKQMASLCLTCL